MFKSKAKRLFGGGKQQQQQNENHNQVEQESEAEQPVARQEYFDSKTCHRTYSCTHCRAHLADHDQLISKLFQGNHGRAYLFNKVVNIGCKQAVQRELLTGLHAVADIYCDNCETTLGWKYEQAFVPSQKYKEGKYIIELVHMLKENNWDLTSYNARELIKEAQRTSEPLTDHNDHFYTYFNNGTSHDKRQYCFGSMPDRVQQQPSDNSSRDRNSNSIDERLSIVVETDDGIAAKDIIIVSNGSTTETQVGHPRSRMIETHDDNPARINNDKNDDDGIVMLTKRGPPQDSQVGNMAPSCNSNNTNKSSETETMTTSISINEADKKEDIELIERSIVRLIVADPTVTNESSNHFLNTDSQRS